MVPALLRTVIEGEVTCVDVFECMDIVSEGMEERENAVPVEEVEDVDVEGL